MNPRHEALVGLVVPGPDRPELLDSREEVLDLVPPTVHLPVVLAGYLPVPRRGNYRCRAALVQIPEQTVRIERPVADDDLERWVLRKLRHPCEVMRLAGKDHETDEAAKRIRDRDDLARQASPGTAESARRRNRLNTLFQLPKCAGRSRHGNPVRHRHSTASRNRLLSAAVTPGSVALKLFRQTRPPHSTVQSWFICHPARLTCAAVPAVVEAGKASIDTKRNPIVNRPKSLLVLQV